MTLINPNPGFALPAHIAAQRQQERVVERQKARLAAAIARNANDSVTREEAIRQLEALPEEMAELEPVGYRILVMLLAPPAEVGGVIVQTDEAREAHMVASPQGIVLAVGSSAYQDRDRFPTGPWCEPGDRIEMGKYAGRPHVLHTGHRLVFLNDDDVLGRNGRGYPVPDWYRFNEYRPGAQR